MPDRRLHGQPVHSDVLRAEERFHGQRVDGVAVNVPARVALADDGRRQVAAASGVLQPRVNRLRVRSRVMVTSLMLDRRA